MKGESKFMLIVDRLEGSTAVVVLHNDDSVKFNLPVESLPEGIREGDHLKVVISADPQGRDIEKRRAEQLLEELQKDSRD